MLYACPWTLWEGLHVLSWIRKSKQLAMQDLRAAWWGGGTSVEETEITTRTSPPFTGRLFWNESQIFKSQLRVCPFPNTFVGFLGGSDGKESTCNAGDLDLIPGAGHGNPLQYSCLEDPHGQRSLAGYSPWGHFKNNFIYLFMAVLGLCCCTGLFFFHLWRMGATL